jgi:hypothetical protein
LAETLEQVGILAESKPVITIVDNGYRGMGRNLKAMIKRRSAIERPSLT